MFLKRLGKMIQKEFKLIQSPLLIGICIIALFTLCMKEYPQSLLFELYFLLLFLPITVLYSLQREAKHLNQWLHNPLSMNELVGIKLLVPTISILFLSCVSILYPIHLISSGYYKITVPVYQYSFMLGGPIDFLISTARNSIMLTVLVLLLWSIYQWLHKKIGLSVWLILFTLFIASCYIPISFLLPVIMLFCIYFWIVRINARKTPSRFKRIVFLLATVITISIPSFFFINTVFIFQEGKIRAFNSIYYSFIHGVPFLYNLLKFPFHILITDGSFIFIVVYFLMSTWIIDNKVEA